MFELSGVNYEEILEQGDSILVPVIASSSYRGFELSGLYCSTHLHTNFFVIRRDLCIPTFFVCSIRFLIDAISIFLPHILFFSGDYHS